MRKKFLTAMAALLSAPLFFMGCPIDDGGGGDPALNGSVVISTTSGRAAATSATTGVTLYAVYSGWTETVTCQWKKDGTPITSGTSARYTPTEAGSYTVTVSAPGCQSKISDPVTITASSSGGLDGTWTASNGRVVVFTGDTFDYKVNGTPQYYGTFSTSGSTITFNESSLGMMSGNFTLSEEPLALSNGGLLCSRQ
ncbi:MAG: hypothetical protein LBK00_00975 [Treponema sp.]|jgi:hypothetical protein|nr:hypothetical protein [Treponema sp.]